MDELAGATPAAHSGEEERPQPYRLRAQLSDGQANTIYRHAYYLGQKGHHKYANALFTLLSMYRPAVPTYVHARAVCCRRMGLHEAAARLFARAMALQPEDHALAFQHIECLMLMGRHDEAAAHLQALAHKGRDTGNATTQERADALLALMRSGTEAASHEP